MLIFLLRLLGPIAVSTANYLLGDRRENWQIADRSSAGLLPKPADHPDALIRVFAARTVRWRGIFAVHTWIVVKESSAPRYSRYDYTAWGDPIRIDGFAPDGRWFGAIPQTLVSVDGEKAEQLIPKLGRWSRITNSKLMGITVPGQGQTPIPLFRRSWTPFLNFRPYYHPPLSVKTTLTAVIGLVSRLREAACSFRSVAISV